MFGHQSTLKDFAKDLMDHFALLFTIDGLEKRCTEEVLDKDTICRPRGKILTNMLLQYQKQTQLSL